MDRAEAVKILEIQLDVTEVNTPSCIKLHEALDLAIEALKEPTGDYEFFGGEYAKEGDAESATTTDCISRADAIEAVDKYYNPSMYAFDTNKIKADIESLPSVTPTEQNEEDILKFYYVESLDEYWIGQRCGTRYYGKWTGNCFTYGYSRYLPWGEHVVAPDTLWKEHTYPSEPKEIPFNEWLQGFLEKECQTE